MLVEHFYIHYSISLSYIFNQFLSLICALAIFLFPLLSYQVLQAYTYMQSVIMNLSATG